MMDESELISSENFVETSGPVSGENYLQAPFPTQNRLDINSSQQLMGISQQFLSGSQIPLTANTLSGGILPGTQQFYVPQGADLMSTMHLGQDLSMSNSMLLSSQGTMLPSQNTMLSLGGTGTTGQIFPGGLMLTGHDGIGCVPMGIPNLAQSGMTFPGMSTGQMQVNAGQAQMFQQQQQQQQQQLQQQQQQRQVIRKSWHSIEDHASRGQMVQRIISLLQQRRPNSTPDWQQKLPQMAKRLEEALYSGAESLDEYQDLNTLKARLQQYAMSVGNKTGQQRSVAPVQSNQNGNSSATPGQMNRPPGVGMAPSQMNGGGNGPYLNSGAGNDLNMSQSFQQGNDAFQTGNLGSSGDEVIAGGTGVFDGSDPNGAIDGNGGNSANAGARSEEHRKQVLKQQQQRLLLLRHASKCPNDDCKVTQHCASMKNLWKHIMGCKEHECKVPHCVSSRYVLSHYSKCKEANCPVCGPVREAIRRNYESTRKIIGDYSKPQASKSTGNDSDPPAPKKSKKQDGGAKAAGAAKAKSNDEPNVEPPKPVRKKPVKKANKDSEEVTSVSVGIVGGRTLTLKPPVQKKKNSLDPISCAIYGFTQKQIEGHCSSIHEGMLNTASEIRQICLPIVDGLLKNSYGGWFAHPVDPVALQLPDYFDIVKHPMDLGSIKKKLESSQYRNPYEVASDITLVFDNAILYNPKENDIHKIAIQYKRIADSQFKDAMKKQNENIDKMGLDPNACCICKHCVLKFEPPVYYCNGRCGGQRIRRNAFFYTTPNNSNHWCHSCFSSMSDFLLTDGSRITKAQLAESKKRHSEDSDEGYVLCDECQRWAHMTCALYNSRRNFDVENDPYICPHCILKDLKSTGEEKRITSTSKMRAADLPHCNMSQFIQRRVEQRLERAYVDLAADLGKSIHEIERCPEIQIRQVASIDKNQCVRDGVRGRYKNYPTEFPSRIKCVILFQNIDGQDVVLFGMYLYEFGHKCPQPNQRRIYVSYLDSVHYFRPRQYRTIVYKEMIIAYLEYVKLRGFHTAHIWACPPLKGDDYILYCHPPDQKTPKDDRLRNWYVDVLNTCAERGIVVHNSDLYTEFLANPNNDLCMLPYFEGDYWCSEAEVIIKGLGKSAALLPIVEDSIAVVTSSTDDEEAKKADAQKSNLQKRTRGSSKGDPPSIPVGTKNRDPVMSKLAAIIQPMKEAFFVARLHPKEYADKWAALLQEEEAKEPEGETKRLKIEEEKALAADSGDTSGEGGKQTGGNVSGEATAEAKDDDNAISKVTDKSGGGEKSKDSKKSIVEGNSTGKASDVAESKESDPSESAKPESRAISAPVGESVEAAKDTDPISLIISKLKDDTEDIDAVQDNDYFNTRQGVLELCQIHHYQFDQLRRAKHTSMMLLYHLHNPDAPKVVPQCQLCKKDVLMGYRYNCNVCDFDVCVSCYGMKPAHMIHNHLLRPQPVGNTAQLTEEQKKERQRSIEMHLHLLRHASSCDNKECKSKNCLKMREFLKHGQTCTVDKGRCNICKRVHNLLQLHARACRNDSCNILKCRDLREQIRQNEQRQQHMDDRRRAMMNQVYNQVSAPASETIDDE